MTAMDKNNSNEKMPITRKILLSVFVFILVITGLVLFDVVPVSANHGGTTSPIVSVKSTQCFQSINQMDDLYCMMRYELPFKITPDPTPIVAGTAEGWCLELANMDGCTDTPVNPVYPKSIHSQHVSINYYENCTSLGDCTLGDLLGTTTVPRIGMSLAGVYIGTGHGVAYGDLSVFGCIEASPVIYTTPTNDCQQVVWASSGNDQDDQRTEMGEYFLVQLLTLEVEQNRGFNYYVQNNLITDLGKTLSLEALNVADRLIGDYFRAAATESQAIEFATATALTSLQEEIRLTATSQAGIWVVVGGHVGGDAKTTGGWLVVMTFGLLGFWAVWAITREFVFPLITFSSIFWFGVSQDAIPFSVVAVYLLVMGTLAIVFGLQKFMSK
jgi:hypothetical protein